MLNAVGDVDLAEHQTRAALLTGLLASVGDGQLPPARFVECVKEIEAFKELGAENYELGDALWMAWLLLGDEEGRDAMATERLVETATALMEKGQLSRRVLMEISDGDFMEAMGLVASYKDGWRKREIRLNTRNVYAQRKFNMLREESEGYSKLLTLLNQSGGAKVSAENLEDILMEIKSLIGYFDLDPNRVSSIILDAFAAHPDNEAFINLINQFGIHKCVEFLGFRLASGETVPEGLHSTAALLVRRGVIRLEDMIAQFAPAEIQYKDWYAARTAKLDESVKKIGVVSLASKAGEDLPARRVGQTARTIELDAGAFRTIIGGDDQRLEFLGHLLSCGAWDEAMILIKHLGDLGVRDVAACECVGKALCAIVCAELDQGANKLSERAVKAIGLLGHHLHFDLRAFKKVLVVVSRLLDGDKKELGQQLLLGTLLPAYNLVPSNAAIASSLWSDALAKLTYPERFRLYAEFGDLVASSPLLQASEKLAETEARRILRRVTAPTNNKDTRKTMRPIGRLLAKVAHSNPFVVCRQLLRQVMGMPGMVASISESLKYLTPMTFDVLTFSIIKQLSSGKRKLKEDGVNLEEWFQWLALFTGIVCRTQRNIEVTALAQLVANNLKQSESLDLLVLKEIITSMTRISPTVDVSNQQLDALAGSQALIQYVVGEEEGGKEIGGKTKDPARVLQRLLVALRQGPENEQLLLPLLLLLAQQKTLITLHPPSKHLKLAAELIDKCQEVTMQYIEFLQKSLSSEEYQALLPSIEDLAVDYKIDSEIIMQLYRPIIRNIKPYAAGHMDGDTGDVGADGGAWATGAAGAMEALGEEDGEVDAGNEGNAVGKVAQQPGNVDPTAWSQLEERLAKLAPEGAFSGMSWELYVCFWAYELADMRVPKARYEGTLKQISISKRNLEDDIASRSGQYSGGQQQSPEVPLEKLKAELTQLKNLSEILPADMQSQSVNVAAVSKVFERASRSWVLGAGASSDASAAPTIVVDAQAAASREFVQYCILPRLFMSPKDAIYCVEFLKRAHKLGPPGFRLLAVLDRLFKELAFIARCSTERESINLGIFFGELMGMVSGWRKKSVFEKELAGSESFKVFKQQGAQVELQPVTFSEWTRLTASWSNRLFDVASSCMAGDYMEMKNMLLILNRCTRVYPSTREDAEGLLAILRPISQDDPREDLKTLARMYCTSLEMSMRDRQMVQTRQEYAGGKPPPKKKEESVKKESAAVKRESAVANKEPTKKESSKNEVVKMDTKRDSSKKDAKKVADAKVKSYTPKRAAAKDSADTNDRSKRERGGKQEVAPADKERGKSSKADRRSSKREEKKSKSNKSRVDDNKSKSKIEEEKNPKARQGEEKPAAKEGEKLSSDCKRKREEQTKDDDGGKESKPKEIKHTESRRDDRRSQRDDHRRGDDRRREDDRRRDDRRDDRRDERRDDRRDRREDRRRPSSGERDDGRKRNRERDARSSREPRDDRSTRRRRN